MRHILLRQTKGRAGISEVYLFTLCAFYFGRKAETNNSSLDRIKGNFILTLVSQLTFQTTVLKKRDIKCITHFTSFDIYISLKAIERF